MQTTYENFRYRYDKKDNPYHKGVKHNLIEVFFSPIPPSLNDFRAYILEDESIVMDPTSPITLKGKIDIEMGSSFAEASAVSLPEILQDLQYDEYFEESTRSKMGNEIADSIPLPSPFLFEANDVVVEKRKLEDGVVEVEDKCH